MFCDTLEKVRKAQAAEIGRRGKVVTLIDFLDELVKSGLKKGPKK